MSHRSYEERDSRGRGPRNGEQQQSGGYYQRYQQGRGNEAHRYHHQQHSQSNVTRGSDGFLRNGGSYSNYGRNLGRRNFFRDDRHYRHRLSRLTSQDSSLLHADGLPMIDAQGRNPAEHLIRALERLQTHVVRTCKPGMDSILDYKNPREPEIFEPVLTEIDKSAEPVKYDLEMSRYKEDYKEYRHDLKDMKEEKAKIFGLIFDHMTDGSKTQVSTCEEGLSAIEKKDPVLLVVALMLTHFVSKHKDSEKSFLEIQQKFLTMRMGQEEDLTHYYKRFEATFAGFNECAIALDRQASLPDESQLVTIFIDSLSHGYQDYKDTYDRRHVNNMVIPHTVKEVFTDLPVYFNPNKANFAKTVMVATSYYSRGGRGRNNSRGGRGHGRQGPRYSYNANGRPACHACGATDHFIRDCPENTKKDVQKAVESVKSEAKSSQKN